jgi:hypothetical protein
MPFHIRKAPNRAKYWVVDDSGKHYSIKPLPLERAKAQQRALYAAEGRGELKGEGFFDSLKEAYNQVADSDSAMWSSVKQVGDLDSQFWSRNFYPKYVQQWLDAHGHTSVKSLRVRRAPIQAGLDYAFQLVSGGKWQDAKNKVGYDNMFHLSLVGNNGGFLMEKLDRINVTDKVDSPPNPQFMDVPGVAEKNLTIKGMLDATQRLMGEQNFFHYHPFTNNCQVFILKVLEANGLLTEGLRDFIFQPVDQIVDDLPGFLPSFAHTLTNLGANINTVVDQAWGIVGKGKTHSLDAFKPKTHKGLRGKGLPAGQTVLWEVADSAYKQDGKSKEDLAGGFYLVEKTNTLVLYTDGKSVGLVGVRGTRPTDTNDLYADSLIPTNMLGTAPRYEQDNATLEGWHQKYPGITEWFGIGHSLGGAIVDEFLRRGLVDEGFSFNPAIQPRDVRTDKHTRLYKDGDPLYVLFGRLDPKAVVVPRDEEGWLYWAWRHTAAGLLYDMLTSHKLGTFKTLGGGAAPPDLEAFRPTDVERSSMRTQDGQGADVFMGGGKHQDAEALFAALEGAALNGGARFPKTDYDLWERRGAEASGRDAEADYKEQELRWRALAHLDPQVNPLAQLGARVLADDLFEYANPGERVDPGHVNAQKYAAQGAYFQERDFAKKLKAEVDGVMASEGFKKREDAYEYILEQRRRKAARAEARPPPPPPPGPGAKKPSPPAAPKKKPSPPAAKVAALPGIPEPPAAAGFQREEVDLEEVRRLEEEAAEAAAREERVRRATAAAEAERKRAAAAEAKAKAEADAAQLELDRRAAALDAARKASAAEKDKKKKAAAEAKRRDAEENELLAREALITKRTEELLVPLDTQIGKLKMDLKDMGDEVIGKDSSLNALNRHYLLIRVRSPDMSLEMDMSMADLQTILDSTIPNLDAEGERGYKDYIRTKIDNLRRMRGKELARAETLKAEAADLRRRIAEGQARVAELEGEKKELIARVRRELSGKGGQHKDFPYSRPDLTKAEKAKERARHYRSIKKAVETLGTKAKVTMLHNRETAADEHEAFHRAKRETEAAAPEKKLWGYYRNLYEVTGELPPEVAPKVAARGPRPKAKKTTMPKEGSVRKPYVGKVMKEAFMKAAAGRGEKEVRNLFNRAKREYKEGGKSWEAVTAAVLGL